MNTLIEQASRYGAVTQEATDLASCLSTLENLDVLIHGKDAVELPTQ